MAAGAPNATPGYWQTSVAGMNAEESKALPSLSLEAISTGNISTIANLKQERDAAMEKWKAENPDRYQEGLRAQERAASGQSQRTQAATNARTGAGGSGGGGASSIDTLLTGTNTQGVDPSALDLSKNTLLGM